jgi:hypothetical protein
MSVKLCVTEIVIAPLGWAQILGESHSVAVVDRLRMSIPESEVGGSCPAVERSSAERPGYGAMVIRGVSVVLTTVTLGPTPGTPVKLGADAPTKVPLA